MHTFNYWGPCIFIELLIMFGPVVGQAIVWVVDGPGLGLGPQLMIVGTRGLVCNILNLEWSTDVVLSSEVGGLGHLCLSSYSFDNYLRGYTQAVTSQPEITY